ncbi:hypothetical protein [Natronomonas sp.]|uniref:hypothetical protein n=1 Tax=Natronomonas sp. TaxID=2184060 RepID=UPI003974EC4D
MSDRLEQSGVAAVAARVVERLEPLDAAVHVGGEAVDAHGDVAGDSAAAHAGVWVPRIPGAVISG